MKDCCIQTGDRFFTSNYPLDSSVKQNSFTPYLINLCKKWGEITNRFVENFYVQTTSSPRLGIDAKTSDLVCGTCGDTVEYIFLGSRLFYFIWRINMIMATYWKMGKTADGENSKLFSMVANSPDWPLKEHLEQVQIAVDMYFGDDLFLDSKGLAELNRQISELTLRPALVHSYIVDFAELFVLFHEIQHQIPLSQLGPEPIGVKVGLPDDLVISDKCANKWITELYCDANSLYLLFLSATSVFMKKFGMAQNDAKVQAASLVCAGADSALYTLQFLEELRYGKVELKDAAFRSEFVNHPPAEFRRDMLGLVSYRLITGKGAESLYRKEFTESWKIVAQNVRSNMQVQDHLFTSYKNFKQ